MGNFIVHTLHYWFMLFSAGSMANPSTSVCHKLQAWEDTLFSSTTIPTQEFLICTFQVHEPKKFPVYSFVLSLYITLYKKVLGNQEESETSRQVEYHVYDIVFGNISFAKGWITTSTMLCPINWFRYYSLFILLTICHMIPKNVGWFLITYDFLDFFLIKLRDEKILTLNLN